MMIQMTSVLLASKDLVPQTQINNQNNHNRRVRFLPTS
jgi:hypothetical protein